MTEHTPHSTANMLKITPVTLRRWCATHAAFLSAGANPPERGEARRFTGKDIEVLKHIKSLRAQGKTEAKINEQLRTLTFAEIEPEANDEETTLEAPPAGQERQDSTVLSIQVLDAISAQNRKIEALERSAIEAKQEQRERWVWIVVGIVLGLGLAAIFEMAALVASRH